MTEYSEVRKKLDCTSGSFCIAKWKQVTLHLQNGHNHSCHHPNTHLASVDEIAQNPSALHNTAFKKERRQEMLDGVQHPECGFCWEVERTGPNAVSDRIVKSASDWAAPFHDEVLAAGAQADINPSYVEVSFSNVCNFKCSYCAPHISSKWMEEIRQYGPYPTRFRFNNLEHLERYNLMPIPEREENPYVDAFWKWWPDLYGSLTDFRITGGEPLLSKNTFRVMEYILENPNPNLRFSVNTNLVVPDALYTRFLDLLGEIHRKKACAGFILYSSVDAYGERAEYIRNGLSYIKWIENVKRYYETIPDWKMVVMSTFNALSPTSYIDMVRDIVGFRVKYKRIILDTPHLRHPEHQNMWVLTDDYGPVIEGVRDFIHAHPKMLPGEKMKIGRIVDLFHAREWPESELHAHRKDFYRFFNEHDRRRGTDFRKTFPEMVPFYEFCRNLNVPD